MADDNFFKDDKVDDTEEQIEQEGQAEETKIKLGDAEYTQEELERLVGLGKIGAEAEEKYQTKIDKVWPNLQRTINEKKELEAKLAEIERSQIENKAAAGEELSPDELAKRARAEAKKLGILTTEDFQQFYQAQRAGERLYEQAEKILEDAKEQGKPQTDMETFLTFMQERGFKDPQDAYDIMFKNDLRDWEMKKLKETKPSGMTTLGASSAGSKAPSEVKVTKENLSKLVAESLGGSQ